MSPGSWCGHRIWAQGGLRVDRVDQDLQAAGAAVVPGGEDGSGTAGECLVVTEPWDVLDAGGQAAAWVEGRAERPGAAVTAGLCQVLGHLASSRGVVGDVELSCGGCSHGGLELVTAGPPGCWVHLGGRGPPAAGAGVGDDHPEPGGLADSF